MSSETAARVTADLGDAEWSAHPVKDSDDRITGYRLVARSAGGERIVAVVPYRGYADWLVGRLNGDSDG